MEVKEQKNLKLISKVLYVLAKILKVLITIAIPFTIIGLIAMIILMFNVDYHDDTLYYGDLDALTFYESIDGIDIKINSELVESTDKSLISVAADSEDFQAVLKIKKALDNNEVGKLRFAVILSMTALVVILFILRKNTQNFEKLFNNINQLPSPFNDENCNLLLNIVKCLVIMLIIELVVGLIVSIVVSSSMTFKVVNSDLFSIVALIGLYYIFKYGTKLQSESKMTFYSDK